MDGFSLLQVGKGDRHYSHSEQHAKPFLLIAIDALSSYRSPAKRLLPPACFARPPLTHGSLLSTLSWPAGLTSKAHTRLLRLAISALRQSQCAS